MPIAVMIASLTIAIGSARANETPPITDGKWRQHPEIEKIHIIHDQVKSDLAMGRLRRTARVFACCSPNEDTGRTLATDDEGVARFYRREIGSDDSALQMEFFYDHEGRPRMVSIVGGAVNGTHIDHHVYIDKFGGRIWEYQVLKKGPGYFWRVWPIDLLVQRPAEEFAAENSCEELPTDSQ